MSWGLTDKRTFETRTFVRPAKPGERPCLSSYRQHGIQKENNAELTACRPFKVTVVRLSCLSGHRKLWKETSAASCFQAAAKKSGSGLSAFGSFRLRGQKWTRKTGVTPLAFFISEGPQSGFDSPHFDGITQGRPSSMASERSHAHAGVSLPHTCNCCYTYISVYLHTQLRRPKGAAFRASIWNPNLQRRSHSCKPSSCNLAPNR